MVRFVQSLDDVENLADGPRGLQRAFLVHHVLQSPSLHQFHDDVWPPLVLGGGVDEDATWMRQRASEFSFLAKTLEGLG